MLNSLCLVVGSCLESCTQRRRLAGELFDQGVGRVWSLCTPVGRAGCHQCNGFPIGQNVAVCCLLSMGSRNRMGWGESGCPAVQSCFSATLLDERVPRDRTGAPPLLSPLLPCLEACWPVSARMLWIGDRPPSFEVIPVAG